MAIHTLRFHYLPRDEAFGRYLAFTHGPFDEWFRRRLEPVPEPRGRRRKRGHRVTEVEFLFHEIREQAWRPDEWRRNFNVCQFSFVCDLSPLRDQPPIENIAKLMQFAAEISAQASWRKVRALGAVLAQPLSEEDRRSLAPCLTWPRESSFRRMGYDGERLEEALLKARREARELYAQARYPGAAPGAVFFGGGSR